MRTYTLSLFSILVFITSCGKAQKAETVEEVEQNTSKEVTKQDIAKIKYTDYILDENVEKLLVNSGEYVQVRDIVENLKKGDLSFFETSKENAKELFKNLRQTMPTELNTESVLARVLVLETKFKKLESLSNLSTTSKEELIKTIKEFFVAFSNLNLQMNKKVEFDNRDIEKP
ncbi:hypothetical protein WJN01_05405 [Flavobacteriaceae bacterium SZ-1-7]|uniref:hypothetical protein n=1 Tax=Tamlana sedimenti TaxID=3134126 RepID=UPI003120E470